MKKRDLTLKDELESLDRFISKVEKEHPDIEDSYEGIKELLINRAEKLPKMKKHSL